MRFVLWRIKEMAGLKKNSVCGRKNYELLVTNVHESLSSEFLFTLSLYSPGFFQLFLKGVGSSINKMGNTRIRFANARIYSASFSVLHKSCENVVISGSSGNFENLRK